MNRRTVILMVLALACGARVLRADPPSQAATVADTGTNTAELTAAQVLDAVVARLPQEPLTIAGDLIVRKPRGVVVREYRFDMELNWGASPAVAAYYIRDAFGAPLEQLTLTRAADGRLATRYAAGNPPVEQPAPPLERRIQVTDFSWTDLTLSFLWWPGGEITGRDTLRSRDCLVIDVQAPPAATAPEALAPYARVRLWIDRELYLLLQAEAFDGAGTRIRRLWVRSVRKQNDRWMIKDLEVQGFPPTQRTRLHVRDSGDAAPSGQAPAGPAIVNAPPDVETLEPSEDP